VGPANFSHKLCEFFISAVGFIEVLHTPEICSGKTIGPRKLFAEIVRQVVNDTLAPGIALLPLDDHPSNICVKGNLLTINRASLTSSVNREQVIKNYLRKLYDKLGVSDRLELALYCLHHQLHKKAPALAPDGDTRFLCNQ
jgi:hypothetical protein